MYSPFDPLPQPPPASTALKRTRSTSPGSLHKKRAPPNYQPSIYSPLPPHLAHSFSSDGIHQPQPQPHASASGSGSSTPGSGGDWVTRTEGLMLATPPPAERGAMDWAGGAAAAGVGGGAMEEDVGMGGGARGGMEMDSMMDSDDPPPANYHPPSTFVGNSHRSDPPQLPHHAPPLYQHLAGSPQASESLASASMSRSSSNSSSLASDMELTSYHHQQPQQPPPLLAAGVPSLSTTQKRTGGGWKVTFGFRHDCQKCLEKVPGHYSHVVSDDGVFSGQ